MHGRGERCSEEEQDVSGLRRSVGVGEDMKSIRGRHIYIERQ